MMTEDDILLSIAKFWEQLNVISLKDHEPLDKEICFKRAELMKALNEMPLVQECIRLAEHNKGLLDLNRIMSEKIESLEKKRDRLVDVICKLAVRSEVDSK